MYVLYNLKTSHIFISSYFLFNFFSMVNEKENSINAKYAAVGTDESPSTDEG